MVDSVVVKRALSRLATGTDTDRVVIESAVAGIDDYERAAAFLDGVGLSQLALAVERQRRAGEVGDVAGGERALSAFQRYRAAATSSARHIHSGRTTDGTPVVNPYTVSLGGTANTVEHSYDRQYIGPDVEPQNR